jgi:hypothetical protein
LGFVDNILHGPMSSVECRRGQFWGATVFTVCKYVNDIPARIANGMQKFADDTKVWCTVNSVEDGQGLENNLDILQNWSYQWLLQFNSSICKVMHVGHDFPTSYHLQNGENLKSYRQ